MAEYTRKQLALLIPLAEANVLAGRLYDAAITVARKDHPVWQAYVAANRRADELYARLLGPLEEVGVKIYRMDIRGSSPSDGISHYDLDDIIEAEFGEDVIVDSEQSQIFITTARAVADRVFARVQELVGAGTVVTYGGDEYPAGVTMEERLGADEFDLPYIAIGSWSGWEKFLTEHGRT